MTWPWAALTLLALIAQHVWLRPRLARRIHRALIPPLRRRIHGLRRSLDALDRATSFHPYQPRHPRRTP